MTQRRDDDSDRLLMGTSRYHPFLKNRDRLTPSQDAMLEHLAYLVLSEHRSACWRDFLNFDINGVPYALQQGTIRNNLSQLRRLGQIELEYTSIYAFYTLPGCRRQTLSTMTPDHTSVMISRRPDLAGLILRLAFGTASIHNIRLRFIVRGIYYALSIPASATQISCLTSTPQFKAAATRKRSRDLVLPEMDLDEKLKAIVTVHKNDTVSVILACSEMPILLDMGGLVRLTSALARIEERILSLIDIAVRHNHCDSTSKKLSSPAAHFMAMATTAADSASLLVIPECGSWLVTMWHIGFDSLERYTGEKFEVAWEDFKGEWIRAYSKQIATNGERGTRGKKAKKRGIIRIERQEYPRDKLHDAVEARLSSLSIRNKREGIDCEE
jgi:hypothetical protein